MSTHRKWSSFYTFKTKATNLLSFRVEFFVHFLWKPLNRRGCGVVSVNFNSMKMLLGKRAIVNELLLFSTSHTNTFVEIDVATVDVGFITVVTAMGLQKM